MNFLAQLNAARDGNLRVTIEPTRSRITRLTKKQRAKRTENAARRARRAKNAARRKMA